MNNETVRQELFNFIAKSGKSQRQIGRETGLSPAVISTYLKGTYKGDNDEVTEKISRYLDIAEERLVVSDLAPKMYLPLTNTREVLDAATRAHKRNDMTLVSGGAGAGKTTALKHYASTNTGVIFVTANICINSPYSILKLIFEAMSGDRVPSRQDDLFKSLIFRLKDTNNLIIIDEADHLNIKSLQAVRSLNDLANVGICLSGNNKIYDQLVMARNSGDYEQLRDRLYYRKKVLNSYKREEISEIFTAFNGNAECLEFMQKLSNTRSLRGAVKFYGIALDYAAAKGKTEIDVKFLELVHRVSM